MLSAIQYLRLTIINFTSKKETEDKTKKLAKLAVSSDTSGHNKPLRFDEMINSSEYMASKAKKIDEACGVFLDFLPMILGAIGLIGIGTLPIEVINTRIALFMAGLFVTGIFVASDLTFQEKS